MLTWRPPVDESLIHYGLDDTGRIYGEIRFESPIYIALHLRRVVGRYMELDLAKAAVQQIQDMTTIPQVDSESSAMVQVG